MKKNGLSAPFKMRKCVTCRENFLSTGPHHRMCNQCRKKDNQIDETRYTVTY